MAPEYNTGARHPLSPSHVAFVEINCDDANCSCALQFWLISLRISPKENQNEPDRMKVEMFCELVLSYIFKFKPYRDDWDATLNKRRRLALPGHDEAAHLHGSTQCC